MDTQAFYCNTTDFAFGPIMYGDAEEFMEWLGVDPRTIEENELSSKYNEFRQQKEEMEEREDDSGKDEMILDDDLSDKIEKEVSK